MTGRGGDGRDSERWLPESLPGINLGVWSTLTEGITSIMCAPLGGKTRSDRRDRVRIKTRRATMRIADEFVEFSLSNLLDASEETVEALAEALLSDQSSSTDGVTANVTDPLAGVDVGTGMYDMATPGNSDVESDATANADKPSTSSGEIDIDDLDVGIDMFQRR